MFSLLSDSNFDQQRVDRVKQELTLLKVISFIESFRKTSEYINTYLAEYYVDEENGKGISFIKDEKDEVLSISNEDLQLFNKVILNEKHWLNILCEGNSKELLIFIIFREYIFTDKQVTKDQFVTLL